MQVLEHLLLEEAVFTALLLDEVADFSADVNVTFDPALLDVDTLANVVKQVLAIRLGKLV